MYKENLNHISRKNTIMSEFLNALAEINSRLDILEEKE